MKITVKIAEQILNLEVRSNTLLLDALREAQIYLPADCGGNGSCGKCQVKILENQLKPLAENNRTEFSEQKSILACQYLINNDLFIEIKQNLDLTENIQNTRQKTGLKANLLHLQQKFDTKSGIYKQFLELSPPELVDQVADYERILAKMSLANNSRKVRIAPHLLANLPTLLREADFKITVTCYEDEDHTEIIALEADNTVKSLYGFVIDLGSTTMALYLIDLNSGETLEAEAISNPQIQFGSDILSRILFANSESAREKLSTLTRTSLANAMRAILKRQNLSENLVYITIIVSNTVMSHLFLGIDASNLARSPFVPCYQGRLTLKGRDSTLAMNPEGYVQILANISSYVGSDALGVIVATNLAEEKDAVLAVDIGTNAEIILVSKGEIFACAAAAGPAFEGAAITMGMRAAKGAIEKVAIQDSQIMLKVLGDCPPCGICGSGLIDAIAELVRVGIIAPDGRFMTDTEHPLAKRLRSGADNIREFVLAYQGEFGATSDIVLTLKDIRELQAAKSAIAAGILVLLHQAKIDDARQIKSLYLAGAFGNYLNIDNAVKLGLFPKISQEKIVPVGNAAATGAKFCLLSKDMLYNSDLIAKNICAVELSSSPEFNQLWLDNMDFLVN